MTERSKFSHRFRLRPKLQVVVWVDPKFIYLNDACFKNSFVHLHLKKIMYVKEVVNGMVSFL